MPKLSNIHLTEGAAKAAKPGDCLSDNEDRGFRLVVSLSGAKRFVAAYRVGPKGKSSKKTIGHFPTMTVSEARTLARKVLAMARSGIDPHAEDEAARNAPTMADLAAVYLDDYAPSQALKQGTISHSRALLTIANATLGKRKVADIAITDIRKLHGDVRAAGIKAGGKGVYQANRLLAVLSKCFALAIERGWRTSNPCKGVPKFPEDQRWHNLTEDEVGRLLDACDAYQEGRRLLPVKGPNEVPELSDPLPESERGATEREAANAIRLLLFTGARLREVLKAEWSQFDLEAGLWEKPSAHTKTKRQHRLELEGPALEILKEMADQKSHPVYLFPGNPDLRRKNAPVDIKTGKPKGIEPRTDLKRPWRAIGKIAGLEGTQLHDLRRTTASFMLSGGASLATVGKALGHTQASTTHRYATLAASVQREGLKAAGERMVAARGKAKGGDVVPFPQADTQ